MVIYMPHAFMAACCHIAQMDHAFVHLPTDGHLGGTPTFRFLGCWVAGIACLLTLTSSFLGIFP